MRIFTPVVAGVALIVAVLAVALVVLDPGSWERALLSLVLLPVGGSLIYWIARRNSGAAGARRSLIRVRAAMVGGGALLISALGFRLAEVLGIETGGGERSIVSLVLVLVVIFGDLLAARMDSKADQVSGED